MGKSPGLRLQASIVQDNVPVEVAPGLFVGSIHAAFNVDALKEKKITHILNLAGTYATFPDDFTYLSISIRDKDYSNLLSCLPIATVFVQAGISAGGVLVHCAGGRSRSPAVAISYLMTKDKLSYEAATGHMKALRSVVSLNTGFETQLKCLERANYNVFDAHQLHLQGKLSALAQRRLDGSLEMASSQSKRRQHRQHQKSMTIPRTPPHPSLSVRSQQRECQAAMMTCCDDRGMLDGNLPSGFSLSLPFTAKKTQFIPALRSMGSMFGCKSCGEHLFCASAIIQHSTESNFNHSSADLLSISASSTPRGKRDDDDACFDEPLSEDTGNNVSTATNTELSVTVTVKPVVEIASLQPPPAPKDVGVKKKKTPLLAKLRLRPQSPSVCSPTGSAKSTPRAANSGIAFPATSDSAGKTDTMFRPDDTTEIRGSILKSLKKEIPKQHDTRSEKEDCGAKCSTVGSGSSTNITTTSSNKGADKLWRTLTAFTAAKRMFKEKKKPYPPSDLSSVDEKKRVKAAAAAEIGESGQQDLQHALFLRENAAAWENSLRMIERSSDGDGEGCETNAQVAALIVADAKVMAMFDCAEWFIEPQVWFMDDLIKSHSGAIRCPNGDCNATVGQWRWDGLSCSCGGKICPGIQMKKNAIQPLGNVTTQLLKGPNDCAPERDDSLYCRYK